MNLIRTNSYEEMCAYVAKMIVGQVRRKPNSVLGLATGSSPLGVYRDLIKLYEEGMVDFSKVFTVNLDEYRGLPATHPESYAYFMKENLFNHINVVPGNTFIPDGKAKKPTVECARYDRVIDAFGGIDLQLLGIGYNGHIGFNEPSTRIVAGTHLVKLSKSTREANSRFFPDGKPPAYAYTVGMKTILDAKTVVLIAGEEKFEIVKRAFRGSITPSVPASLLQLHPNVTIVYMGKEEI